MAGAAVGPEAVESSMAKLVRVMARSSYYISLLGLKIPLGLLARASHARLVLALISVFWVPGLVYCHVSLVPAVREAEYGIAIWHTLTALWVTLPLLVVGSVILSHVRATEPVIAFFTALVGVLCFHRFLIPLLQPTHAGTWLLQLMFAFFEDGSIAGWLWCLFFVVRLQDHVQKGHQSNQCPIEVPKGDEDRVLIVGNAPTLVDGPALGAEIDAFSEVVRFNSYHVGQPSHTGTKVSYHFCNGRKLPQAKTIRAVLPLFNASLTHAVYLFMPHMEEARQTCENLMSAKASVWFVDEQLILDLRRKIKCNFWQIPSSGMVAIGAFLQQHKEVTLVGFNFFSGKKIHYFEESPTQLITSWLERFVTHNPPQEKKWVESLLKGGRATFLSDKFSEAVQHTSPTSSDSEVCESKDKKGSEDGEARRRAPGLVRTLLRDGLPSQFSI